MIKKSILKERNKLIKDLEKIFKMALLAQDYKSALQAKQIIGKMKGFLDSNDKKIISLAQLTETELLAIIAEAKEIKENETKAL